MYFVQIRHHRVMIWAICQSGLELIAVIAPSLAEVTECPSRGLLQVFGREPSRVAVLDIVEMDQPQ